MVPTVSCPGLLAPLLFPFLFRGASAAFKRSHDVCGVLRSKWKDRSGRTVTRQGIGVPGVMCAVLALNSCKVSNSTAVSSVPRCANWPCCAAIAATWPFPYLAEVHRFDTLTSQRRTNGRTGTRLAGSDYQLDNLIDSAGCAFRFRHLDGTVALLWCWFREPGVVNLVMESLLERFHQAAPMESSLVLHRRRGCLYQEFF